MGFSLEPKMHEREVSHHPHLGSDVQCPHVLSGTQGLLDSIPGITLNDAVSKDCITSWEIFWPKPDTAKHATTKIDLAHIFEKKVLWTYLMLFSDERSHLSMILNGVSTSRSRNQTSIQENKKAQTGWSMLG